MSAAGHELFPSHFSLRCLTASLVPQGVRAVSPPGASFGRASNVSTGRCQQSSPKRVGRAFRAIRLCLLDFTEHMLSAAVTRQDAVNKRHRLLFEGAAAASRGQCRRAGAAHVPPRYAHRPRRVSRQEELYWGIAMQMRGPRPGSCSLSAKAFQQLR